MRKHLVLFGALLLTSVPALAQDNQAAQLQPPAQPTTPPAVKA